MTLVWHLCRQCLRRLCRQCMWRLCRQCLQQLCLCQSVMCLCQPCQVTVVCPICFGFPTAHHLQGNTAAACCNCGHFVVSSWCKVKHTLVYAISAGTRIQTCCKQHSDAQQKRQLSCVLDRSLGVISILAMHPKSVLVRGHGCCHCGDRTAIFATQMWNSCCLFAGVPGTVSATAPASVPETVLVAVSGADPAELKASHVFASEWTMIQSHAGYELGMACSGTCPDSCCCSCQSENTCFVYNEKKVGGKVIYHSKRLQGSVNIVYPASANNTGLGSCSADDLIACCPSVLLTQWELLGACFL